MKIIVALDVPDGEYCSDKEGLCKAYQTDYMRKHCNIFGTELLHITEKNNPVGRVKKCQQCKASKRYDAYWPGKGQWVGGFKSTEDTEVKDG